jgi:Nif-specific regulatory protein
MKKMLQMIQRISGADSTVLIHGETGTGKELAARAIHANSPRADAPFIAINCAALPESLLESELFGHEKGAFTGALAQKKGKVEVAAGGTLFLDEIAELAPAIQAKLLRFLQEREFERLGGTRAIKVDLRVIVATNKDLAKEVAAGKFRQDLFYRLNVVSLETPALRDVQDDILLLANYFVSRFSQKLGRRVHGISPAAQQCLKNYDWPGNVRELENVLERAILLGSTDTILPDDLPDSILSQAEAPASFHEAVNEYKKKLIQRALEANENDYQRAAQELGIHFTHLYRLMRSFKLEK